MIRVLLAEDQAMVLGALARSSTSKATSRSSAQARSGDEALEPRSSLDPDVVVTDIEMPGLSGLELAAEARRRGVHRARSSSSRPSRGPAICAARSMPARAATC